MFRHLKDEQFENDGIALRIQHFEHLSTDNLTIPSYLIGAPSLEPALSTIVYNPPGIWGGLITRRGEGYDMNILRTCEWFIKAGSNVYIVDRRGAWGHGDEYAGKVDLFRQEVDDIITSISLARSHQILSPKCGMFGYCSGGTLGALVLKKHDIFSFVVFVSSFYDLQQQFSRQTGFEKWDQFLRETHSEFMRPDFPFDKTSPIFLTERIDPLCDIHLLHGQNDQIVQTKQAMDMYTMLKNHGKKVTLHLTDDFDHDRNYAAPGQSTTTWLWELVLEIMSQHDFCYPRNLQKNHT